MASGFFHNFSLIILAGNAPDPALITKAKFQKERVRLRLERNLTSRKGNLGTKKCALWNEGIRERLANKSKASKGDYLGLYYHLVFRQSRDYSEQRISIEKSYDGEVWRIQGGEDSRATQPPSRGDRSNKHGSGRSSRLCVS